MLSLHAQRVSGSLEIKWAHLPPTWQALRCDYCAHIHRNDNAQTICRAALVVSMICLQAGTLIKCVKFGGERLCTFKCLCNGKKFTALPQPNAKQFSSHLKCVKVAIRPLWSSMKCNTCKWQKNINRIQNGRPVGLRQEAFLWMWYTCTEFAAMLFWCEAPEKCFEGYKLALPPPWDHQVANLVFCPHMHLYTSYMQD